MCWSVFAASTAENWCLPNAETLTLLSLSGIGEWPAQIQPNSDEKHSDYGLIQVSNMCTNMYIQFKKTLAHSKCLSSMATPWEGDERRGIGKKPGQSDTRIQHEVGEGEGISVKPYFPTHCGRSSQSTGCQKKSCRKTLFKKIFEILIIKVHISNDFKFLTTITFISSINYQVIPHIT